MIIEYTLDKEILEVLLQEHAYELANKDTNKHNIFYATDNYESNGNGFQFSDEIQLENTNLIQPRVKKTKEEQRKRTRDKAEVFTPTWICNKQNNLVDHAWFECEDVFNTEKEHEWIPNLNKIVFKNKQWQDYVNDNRLEITCGEAPYLVSRYDTTTGDYFDSLYDRIGLLDRKLRIVNENVNTLDEWFLYAFNAIKSTYGFEWQGDNLYLARVNILFTFIDYYKEFISKLNSIENDIPNNSVLKYVANIISYNIVQMDGLKMVLPDSCHDVTIQESLNLFDETYTSKTIHCKGCEKNDIHNHNGIYQYAVDWDKTNWQFDEKPIEIIEYHKLIK